MRNRLHAMTLLTAVLALSACQERGRELPKTGTATPAGSSPASAVPAASTPEFVAGNDAGGKSQEGVSALVVSRTGGATPGLPVAKKHGSNPASAAATAASGSAVARTSSPEERAHAEKQAWLTSPLYGGDNAMAKPKRVTITPKADKAGYQVHITNQLSFVCNLGFNSKGQPARLSSCTTTLPENREWKVVQKRVPLHCSTLAKEVVCSGTYDLGMPAGGTYPGRMTIARAR